DAPALGAGDLLGPAADLCVRGHAGTGAGAHLPGRPDARGPRAQCALFRRLRPRLPGPFEKRPPAGFAHAVRRITIYRSADKSSPYEELAKAEGLRLTA